MSKPEIDSFGTKRWKNSDGKLHREDGPAIEYTDGHKSWYINGKFFSEEEFNKEMDKFGFISKEQFTKCLALKENLTKENEISAEVLLLSTSPDGLTIQFTIAGQMERNFRSIMNEINENSPLADGPINSVVTGAMEHVLCIAFDSVELVRKHKNRLY